MAMALVLSILGLACLAFIAGLTVDGLRALLKRRRREQAGQPISLIVAERTEVAGELLCIKLQDARGKTLPAFAAGQHLLLQAPAGRAGKTIQRAYSLAAWQKKPGCYELGIKREAQGAMTPWLWQHLRPGERIAARRPQGQFVVETGCGPLVLIGGGIGITPMRAMLHEALASRRQIVLFHAARTADLLLYRDEFAALAERHRALTYVPVLSRPDAAWSGLDGRLDAPRIVSGLALPGEAEFYLCAGNAMMDALHLGLVEQGIAPERIHREAFGVAAGAGLAGLNVTVTEQGGEKTLQAAGEPTLLATLEANGIELPAECRAGSCGQCQVQLDSGEVDWLVAPEFKVGQARILPCVCSARSHLAISTVA
jgi:ferredoxin-NADP reductase